MCILYTTAYKFAPLFALWTKQVLSFAKIIIIFSVWKLKAKN